MLQKTYTTLLLLFSLILFSCGNKEQKKNETKDGLTTTGTKPFQEMYIFRPEGEEEIEEDFDECGDYEEEYTPFLYEEYQWDIIPIQQAEQEPIADETTIKNLQEAFDHAYECHYWGKLLFPDTEVPLHRKTIYIETEDGKTDVIYESKSDRQRRYDYQDVSPSLTYRIYMEYVANQRHEFNFFDLYQNNKSLIFKIVTPEKYRARYADMVKGLLYAYNDIQNDESLMAKIERIMRNHEIELSTPEKEQLTKNPYWMDDYILPRLEEIIPNQSIRHISDLNTNLVWVYSFWARRAHEGKTDEIYNTLKAIRDDYQNRE